MEEWKTYKIRDIATVNLSQYSLKEGWNEVTYLDTGSITENHIEDIQTFILPCDDFPSRARRKVQHNDILFSTVRPNQKHFGILKNPNDNLLVSTGFSVITVNPLVADANFVYYYITQQEIINYLQSVAEQSVSAYPSLKSSDIEDIDIELPSLYEQRRLALILKSIDDKIENNNRINHNLEEQADGIVSSLFNVGTTVLRLSDICKYVSQRIDCQSLTLDNYISTENMVPSRGGVTKSSNVPTGTATEYSNGDILVSNIRPYFQKIWKATYSGGCSNDVLCFRSSTNSPSFLYHLLRQNSFFDHVMAGAKGSKMPRGDKAQIMNWTFVLSEDWEAMESKLFIIDKKVALLRAQNLMLIELRDSVLPRLMSGELEINDLTC